MNKRATHTFDAPIEDVWAMLNDPASHVAKAERAGHENVEIVEEQIDETGILVKLARDVTLELPGFAKKVLSPRNHIVSIDEWRDQGDGTYGGTFTSDFKGAPIDLQGRTRIAPDGPDRTTYEVEIDVKVKVPVVGKKIESWAEGDVEEQMQNEFAAGDEWLASH
ncbi:DUF2505 domain-containing protein [Nitriliruptor alkaliphilus]|uniref:DUF2505 domain-containing protein n=1 Tax=Nitriliruptor alkaliphilus TaxID=427918 RepID=UPI00069668B1|nr:DUF2505 domain-containing protein [Nitriliruptor alkaliphilus]